MSGKEDSERLEFLFKKFLEDRNMTAEELRELQDFVYQKKFDSEFEMLLKNAMDENDFSVERDEFDLEVIFQKVVNSKIEHVSKKDTPIHWMKNFRWPAAAAIILMILFTGYQYFFNLAEEGIPLITQWKGHDIEPGGNKASLTMPDGTLIELSEFQEGIIADEEGISYADGTKVSEGLSNLAEEKLTLQTPPGGVYHITLSDGTKVWLNAMSKLHYPSRFNGQTRNVTLEGEGYFEVSSKKDAKGAALPFVVHTSEQSLTVLGTKFNITSYLDENRTITTLVEGLVKVSSAADSNVSALLKPNDQSQISREGKKFNVEVVDTDYATAWQKGIFQFRNANIRAIMHQLSKWYDLDVVFKGEIPPTVFTGKVYRNLSLSQVLEILSFSKINYELNGNSIIISPDK